MDGRLSRACDNLAAGGAGFLDRNLFVCQCWDRPFSGLSNFKPPSQKLRCAPTFPFSISAIDSYPHEVFNLFVLLGKSMEFDSPQFGFVNLRLAGHGSPVTARRSRLAGHGSPISPKSAAAANRLFRFFQSFFRRPETTVVDPRQVGESADHRRQRRRAGRAQHHGGNRRAVRVGRVTPCAPTAGRTARPTERISLWRWRCPAAWHGSIVTAPAGCD